MYSQVPIELLDVGCFLVWPLPAALAIIICMVLILCTRLQICFSAIKCNFIFSKQTYWYFLDSKVVMPYSPVAILGLPPVG